MIKHLRDSCKVNVLILLIYTQDTVILEFGYLPIPGIKSKSAAFYSRSREFGSKWSEFYWTVTRIERVNEYGNPVLRSWSNAKFCTGCQLSEALEVKKVAILSYWLRCREKYSRRSRYVYRQTARQFRFECYEISENNILSRKCFSRYS